MGFPLKSFKKSDDVYHVLAPYLEIDHSVNTEAELQGHFYFDRTSIQVK